MTDNKLLFPAEAREIAREAFIEGWHKRVGEEDLSDISRKAAESRFDQWYDSNYE